MGPDEVVRLSGDGGEGEEAAERLPGRVRLVPVRRRMQSFNLLDIGYHHAGRTERRTKRELGQRGVGNDDVEHVIGHSLRRVEAHQELGDPRRGRPAPVEHIREPASDVGFPSDVANKLEAVAKEGDRARKKGDPRNGSRSENVSADEEGEHEEQSERE